MEGIHRREAAEAEPRRKRARVDDVGGGGAVAAAEEGDRLSDLPDDLLEGILALLGSRQAVQTSVLSRRWRHLWRGVRSVDIDLREFRARGNARFDSDGMEDFADAILSPALLGSGPELDSFRLHLDEDGVATNFQFQRWIRRALRRCPASVDIHYRVRTSIDWPPAVTLIPAAATSHIKTLRLFGLRPTVFLGPNEFPVLEDLHIERCFYGFSTITSSTLKNLAVISPIDRDCVRELVLIAPSLTSLHLDHPYGRAHGLRVISARSLASVLDASISMVDTDPANERNRPPNLAKFDFLVSVSDLLGRLTGVRNLELTGLTATVYNSEKFPVFPLLKALLLNDCAMGNKIILKQAPNLEQLRLHNMPQVLKKTWFG
uniref:F-box domain-containing protein n=1 Tax=Oryza barthii TaxID=65489 RepID=A0A0D3FW53_9ORYZ